MGTAEQKTLGWIDQAPFSFSGSAMTKASPDAVFAVLADHERWPEWFPVITKTVVLGEQREGVGTRRLTNIPGGSIEEVILAWDVGRRFCVHRHRCSPGNRARAPKPRPASPKPSPR